MSLSVVPAVVSGVAASQRTVFLALFYIYMYVSTETVIYIYGQNFARSVCAAYHADVP